MMSRAASIGITAIVSFVVALGLSYTDTTKVEEQYSSADFPSHRVRYPVPDRLGQKLVFIDSLLRNKKNNKLAKKISKKMWLY